MEARNVESMAILSALTEADWSRPVYSAEAAGWLVRDVIAHLADSERGLVSQMQRLVAGGQTIPPDFDLNRWNRRSVEKRAGKTVTEHLAEIQDAFHQALALLETVTDSDLDKVGRHPRGDEPTLEVFFRHLANHRAGHAADIKASAER